MMDLCRDGREKLSYMGMKGREEGGRGRGENIERVAKIERLI